MVSQMDKKTDNERTTAFCEVVSGWFEFGRLSEVWFLFGFRAQNSGSILLGPQNPTVWTYDIQYKRSNCFVISLSECEYIHKYIPKP